MTRNRKFALSPSYSTRTKVVIQGSSYEYSSSYFVKEVIKDEGIQVDEWVIEPEIEDKTVGVSKIML